jgi:hypothetical protein
MGIWLILYGLDKTAEDEYLEWFHDVHIPEKLARPGYDWAAHYRVFDSDVRDAVPEYVALFGGETSRPFYNPSPAQIKPHQDELTRRMMGYRVKTHMQILTQEWSEIASNLGQAAQDTSAVNSDCIRLQLFADSVADQSVAAWCAQELFKSELADSCSRVRKLVASTGTPRHVVLQEHSKFQATSHRDGMVKKWSQEHGDSSLSELRAERCWPASSVA